MFPNLENEFSINLAYNSVNVTGGRKIINKINIPKNLLRNSELLIDENSFS